MRCLCMEEGYKTNEIWSIDWRKLWFVDNVSQAASQAASYASDLDLPDSLSASADSIFNPYRDYVPGDTTDTYI